MNRNGNKKQLLLIHLLIAIITALLLSYTLFSELLVSGTVDGMIQIEATAKKARKSLGTDIRIISVSVDGESIPLDTLDRFGEWEQRDGVILIASPREPRYLEYHVESAQKLEVVFQKHEGSGIARIKVNGKSIAMADLYSKDWDSVVYTRKLGEISIFQHKVIFGLLTIFLWISISFLQYLIRYMKENKKKRIAMFVVVLLSLMIYKLSDCISDRAALMICLCIIWFASILSVTFYYLEQCDKYGENWKNLTALFVPGILSSIYVYIVVELVTGNYDWNMDYAVGNTLIYLVIYLIVYFIGRSALVATVGQIVISYLFAVVNFYVTSFRGTPIVPQDFLAAG